MTTPDLSGVLAEVSSVNGYFHLFTGPGDGSWRPMADLFTDRAALESRLLHTAELLETKELRVAASLLHLGFAARLWSPPLGAAVLHGQVLEWTPERLFWRPAPGGPLPLRMEAPAVRTDADPAVSLYRDVAALLEPLGDLTRSLVKISPRLLWDNAASSLAGAVQVLARQHPDKAAAAIALGRRVLDLIQPPAGHRLFEPAPGRPFFVRAGCCLYYRIPGGGTCLDCALNSEETRRALWDRALRPPS